MRNLIKFIYFGSMVISLFALSGCGSRSTSCPEQIISIQMINRNGFSETISTKDRLEIYQKIDFLTAQPYQKVLRVFGRDASGKSLSKITSYHSNSQPWQYLEAIDSRANGLYREWYENGQLKIEAHVMEGMPDLSDIAQTSWLFNGPCFVWDDQGRLEADFLYDKGILQGDAHYYHPNGKLATVIPYDKNLVHGRFTHFDEQGQRIEVIPYNQGKKEGEAFSLWHKNQLKYLEQYHDESLICACYWTIQGEKIAQVENGNGKQALFQEDRLHSLIEYKEGKSEGLVELYNADGLLVSTYVWKDSKKEGEEWEYYSNKNPKLLLNWCGNKIQGIAKTWYENGVLESQREMSNNKKQGLSLAYYKNGDLMFMEEYESDRLVSGSYYPKGKKNAFSKIENGEGIATIYDSDGHYVKKISYERGRPVID